MRLKHKCCSCYTAMYQGMVEKGGKTDRQDLRFLSGDRLHKWKNSCLGGHLKFKLNKWISYK